MIGGFVKVFSPPPSLLLPFFFFFISQHVLTLCILFIIQSLQRGVSKIKKKFKQDKSKDEPKLKVTPTPVNNSNVNNDRVGRQKKKQEHTVEERTGIEADLVPTAIQNGKKNPTSPNVTSPSPLNSPHIASPGGSGEKLDDSKGERDQSEGGATAKSLRDGGLTEHYGQFLDHMAGKGWQKVADEFKTGYRTNAEVNRTTRYVISFNVPPDGDFYDANRVDFPSVEPKFVLAAACPSFVVFLENYEAETKELKEKPIIPCGVGDTQDYGKMNVSNKKTTMAVTMEAVLEILPEGCSNSVITRFVQVLKWPETVLGDADDLSRNSAIHAVRMITDEKKPIVVVCNNGCGRSAMFVMLYAILTRLNARLKVSVLSLPFFIVDLPSPDGGNTEVGESRQMGRNSNCGTVPHSTPLASRLHKDEHSKCPRLKDQTTAMKKSLKEYVEKTYAKKK